MKFAKRSLSKQSFCPWIALAVLLAIWMFLLLGCAPTVIPMTVHDQAASYDGISRNSGFLGFDAAGLGYLTPHARDRYNADTGRTNEGILPAVQGTQLIERGKVVCLAPSSAFTIDPEHLVSWTRVLRAKKLRAP